MHPMFYAGVFLSQLAAARTETKAAMVSGANKLRSLSGMGAGEEGKGAAGGEQAGALEGAGKAGDAVAI